MTYALRRAPWLLLLVTVAAAAAGAGSAVALLPGEAAAPARSAAVSVPVLRAGAARLALPEGWRPLRRSPLPALPGAAAARGLYSDVAVDARLPDDPSLLPAPLRQAAGEQASPAPRRVGGRVAWAYDLAGPRRRTRTTALVLPTTRGVLTVACTADESFSVYAALDCDDALAQLQLPGAVPVPPAPETAVRIAAVPAVARLDRERRAGRRALASTRSPRGRAAAARRIAGAYAVAARRLEPLARGAATALPAVLTALARDHRALAAASARRDAADARAAGRAIGRHERELAARLAEAPR